MKSPRGCIVIVLLSCSVLASGCGRKESGKKTQQQAEMQVPADHKAAPAQARSGEGYDFQDCIDAAFIEFNMNKDLPAAIKYYDKAIELRPKYASAFNNRGALRLKTGDVDGAIADLTKAIALDSEDAMALANRSMAYEDKGDSAKAQADLNAAKALDSEINDPSLQLRVSDVTFALSFEMVDGKFVKNKK